MIYLKLVFDPSRDLAVTTNISFLVILFINPHQKKKKKHNFTKAQFEKDKTTVWIKWPTQGCAIYV